MALEQEHAALAAVLAGFVSEYAADRTPNACVRCNEKIRFAAVLDPALRSASAPPAWRAQIEVTGDDAQFSLLQSQAREDGQVSGGQGLVQVFIFWSGGAQEHEHLRLPRPITRRPR